MLAGWALGSLQLLTACPVLFCGAFDGVPQDWESRDPRQQKAPVVKKPRVSGPSVLNLFHIGPLQQSSQLDQQHTQPQARQQQTATQQQQQAKQQQARQGSGGGPAGAVNGAPADEQIEAFMTEEEREALAARQAALREAQEQVRANSRTTSQQQRYRCCYEYLRVPSVAPLVLRSQTASVLCLTITRKLFHSHTHALATCCVLCAGCSSSCGAGRA